MGNDPRIYSTIGDCQSEPNVFMGIYATDRYYLGEDYSYLQETIDYYRDAFQLKSQGVRDGLSAPSALSSTWADPLVCNKGENPVECELRLHKPSIIFINLGTNWKPGASADKYEEYLRKIVDIVVQHGVLPVLSTKADNVEGDHSLNRATARVAHDYDIPLWNFWRAAQSLPNNGLDGERDSIYLAPEGWDRRNFTALQVLDAIRRSVQGLPLPSGDK
ncbi:MAG: SGNH/GDSL hydrolase family protein [Anaerolineae bacterium]|nr:SGNH/GDSL hydrolase family protein [Anaerolineae bacterium]